MPYRIVRDEGKYCLEKISDGSRVPGSCHVMRRDTQAMQRAMEASMNGKEFVAMTPAEQDVSRLILAGMSYKQIAAYKNVSITTVRSHTQSVFAKFSVQSRSALIMKLLYTGSVSVDELPGLYELGHRSGCYSR